jgi:hypothetical protein
MLIFVLSKNLYCAGKKICHTAAYTYLQFSGYSCIQRRQISTNKTTCNKKLQLCKVQSAV